MSARPRNNNHNIRIVNDDVSEAAPRVLTITEINTAGNETYTVAQLLGGLILRDGDGYDVTDELPSAGDVITALGGADNVSVGTSFELHLRNVTSGDIVTINCGSSDYVHHPAENLVISPNSSKNFLFVVTDPHAPQINLYLKSEATWVYP